MPDVTKKMREIQENCPVGYTVAIGQSIDMLGAKELWRIFENHPEPDMCRIPQDFIDYSESRQAKRVPKEWGKCLYYKVVK